MREFIDRSQEAAHASTILKHFRQDVRAAYNTAVLFFQDARGAQANPDTFEVGSFLQRGVYEMSASTTLLHHDETPELKEVLVRIGQERKTWYNRLGGERYILVEVSHIARGEHPLVNIERYLISHEGRIGLVFNNSKSVEDIPLSEIENRVNLITNVVYGLMEQSMRLQQNESGGRVQNTSLSAKRIL